MWASVAVAHTLSSCGTLDSLLRGMWDLCGPGLEPVSPPLAGGFLTTVPPGKPLFVSFSNSFISVLQFSEYRSFASLGRFIPRYFIPFDLRVNGVFSLISLSDLSFLVYRNANRVLCINFVSCNLTEFIDEL